MLRGGLRLALWGVMLAGIAPTSRAVNVWITSGDRASLLSQKVDTLFDAGTGQGGIQINIDPTQVFQTVDGFGAAMTDSSAWVLQKLLSPSQRQSVMRTLFSPQTGIGINYLRVPLGASDFSATGAYSYDDMPSGQTDPNLNNFSINHDQAYVIPQLQAAKNLNPQLKLMATPWSAPGWMKTSGSMIGGSLSSQWSASYALYLQKALQAYSAAGLPFDTMSIQNEPLYIPADYPGMGMSASQQSDLIRNYIGPGFAAAGITTKILAYDHNWDNTAYPLQVLSDPVTKQYVAGTAFHGYGGSVPAQSTVANAYPDKGIYFTEFTGGTWATNFGDNLISFAENQFIGATQNYAKNVMLWNLALDQNGGPHSGGCSGCRGVVTVNSNTGAVTLNEEFYSIGQASKFIMPGAVRIYSSTQPGVLDAVAFRNPDSSDVLLTANATSQPQTLRVVLNGEHFSYSIPAKSLATFVWGANQADFNNGSFEEGGYQNGGGSLDAWQTFGGNGSNLTLNATQSLDGTHSLRLAANGVGGSTAGAFQGMSTQAGQIVHAEVSDLVRGVESFAGSTNSVQMKLEFYNAFGGAENSASFLGESTLTIADASSVLNSWQQHDLYIAAPEGAVEARLSFLYVDQAGNKGAAYLDSAKLESGPQLPGDYNGDGVVDTADYVLWRASVGAATLMNRDPANTGAIGSADYDSWKSHFGNTAGPGSGAGLNGGSVPEPSTILLACIVMAGICSMRLRGRHLCSTAVR
jgi:glucosylceramidase